HRHRLGHHRRARDLRARQVGCRALLAAGTFERGRCRQDRAAHAGAGEVTRLLVLLALMLPLLGSAALAVEPNEMLSDPTLEARARDISKGLRCLVCQNESIDDSGADLAHDLRVLVRERLTAGDSDAQVVDYLVKRYGDFVLLKPPVAPRTWLLW